jgi:oligoribonuclease
MSPAGRLRRGTRVLPSLTMQDAGNLVWIDLEMTGLLPAEDRILEIACLVTDSQLNLVAEGPSFAIHEPDAVLAKMDEWCRKQHGDSGLTARVRASQVGLAEAEAKVLDFVRQWTQEKTSPLCGNSIGHDRNFLKRHMPSFEAWLHYRVIDVSTVKELVRRWYPKLDVPKKKGQHLALGDIRESIDELRFYREHVFKA